MNKQMANFGRRLSAAEMKKTTGGIRVGTGSALKCAPPPPPNCVTVYTPGDWTNCCKCCSDADACLDARGQDPVCWAV